MRTHIYVYIYKYVLIMTFFTNGKKNYFQSVLVILVWWPNEVSGISLLRQLKKHQDRKKFLDKQIPLFPTQNQKSPVKTAIHAVKKRMSSIL